MTHHNNGRKYYHLVRCYRDKEHLIETDGMWFGLEEKKCPKHKYLAEVIKANMTKYDAEVWKESA